MHDAHTYLLWALRKIEIIGSRDDLEALNYQGVQIAKEVEAEGNAFLTGNISNTWVYDPGLKHFQVKLRYLCNESSSSLLVNIFYQHFYYKGKK